MSDGGQLLRFVVTLPLLIVSLVLHELAHGYVAARLGDPTARQQGRLTINPLVHLDAWGTIALVVTFVGSGGTFFFGWAKPVSVSPWYFANPQRAMMLVGAAGPAANFCLALVAAGLIWSSISLSMFAAEVLALAFLLNVVLGVINLLPIPPLDGSRVLGGFLPRDLYARWTDFDRYGSYVFLGLFVVMLAAPQLFNATIGAVLDWSFGLLPGGGG